MKAIAGMAAAGAIGYSMGKSIAKSKQIKKMESEIFDVISNKYGNLIALEVNNIWLSHGSPLDFSYIKTAENVVDIYIYRHIAKTYNENTADFIEGRMMKSREKGIEIDFDIELSEFVKENGGSLSSDTVICDYLNKLKQHQEKETLEIRNAIINFEKPQLKVLVQYFLSIIIGFFLVYISIKLNGVVFDQLYDNKPVIMSERDYVEYFGEHSPYYKEMVSRWWIIGIGFILTIGTSIIVMVKGRRKSKEENQNILNQVFSSL